MRRVAVLTAALLVTACGSTDGRSGSATSSAPTDPTASAAAEGDRSGPTSADVAAGPTLPTGQLDLLPLRDGYDELPGGELVDGGCSFRTPADVVSAPLIVRGDIVSVSERGEYGSSDDPGGVVVGRMVELAVDEVVVDDHHAADPGATLWALTSEERIQDGVRYVGADILAEVTAGQRDVLAVAYLDPATADRVVPRLAHAVVDDGGRTRLDGNCHQLGEQIDWIADALGDPSGLEMLVRFARASDGNLAELDRASAAWIDGDAPPPWELQDPRQRSLVPSLVPADLRAAVDVVGVWVAIDDADTPVFVRTESGQSAPGLSPTVLPGAMPAYFLDTDTTIEVFVTGESERTIGTIAVDQVLGEGGIEVSGSLGDDDVRITVLSRAELADRLSVEVELLETLRQQYLDR